MKFEPAGNLRPKNYTAANSILIAAQDAIELARRWGGGLVCQTIAITWYACTTIPLATFAAGACTHLGTRPNAIPRCSTSSPRYGAN